MVTMQLHFWAVVAYWTDRQAGSNSNSISKSNDYISNNNNSNNQHLTMICSAVKFLNQANNELRKLKINAKVFLHLHTSTYTHTQAPNHLRD